MFSATCPSLLDELDGLVGSREETCELIALASAAVLTASPHGAEQRYLQQVQAQLRRSGSCFAAGSPTAVSWSRTTSGASRAFLNNRIGPAFPGASRSGGLASDDSEARRTAALRHLLETLAGEHGPDAEAILERLRVLAAEALSALAPASVRKWSALLERTRRSVQRDFLLNNPDLN